MIPALRALPPNRTELLAALAASLGIIIWPQVLHFNHWVTGLTLPTHALASSPLLGDVAVGLFWIMVGVIGYVLIHVLSNTVIDLHNDLVIARDYTNKGDGQVRLEIALAQAGTAVLAALVLGLWVPLLPLLLQTSYTLGQQPLGWAAALGAVILLALLMVVPWRLVRLALLLPAVTSASV